MGTKSSPEGRLPSAHIAALIDAYFERKRAGETVTPESFAAEHPDLAADLAPYLQGVSLLEKIGNTTRRSEGRVYERIAEGTPPIEAYDVVEEIGRGGMGIVYKAIQPGTKRTVALKVMLGGAFASEPGRARFEREIELAARLEHPAIVRVLESRRDSGVLYYAMDYVDGVTLSRHFAHTKSSTREVLEIMAQVCEAVDYAHQRGVIHRDLKPANILIDHETHRPHLTDFGLAKIAAAEEAESCGPEGVSVAGQVLGTLPYLSPEQAIGGKLDRRSDVYALGVILYQAVTGQLPYDISGRPSDVIQRILDATPRSPSSMAAGVDPDVETIVLTALQKEPGRRYQSAGELGEDIRHYLHGDPILARRPSTIYYLRKKITRHRFASAAAVAVLLTLIVVPAVRYRLHARDLARARLSATNHQNALEGNQVANIMGPARSAWEQFPELRETGLVWAQALQRSGQRDKAIWFLESELRRNPSQWAFRALLADVYDAIGEVDRAAPLRARSIQEAPDTGAAWHVRSFATFDVNEARRCAEEAERRSSRDIAVLHRLADLRLQTGDLEGTLALADRLMAMDGNEYEWTTHKAHIYVRQGRYNEAVDLYTHTIELAPDAPTPYHYRAHALRRLGRYEEAVVDYTKAIELDGIERVNVWRHYQRAIPLWILGRTKEAMDDCRLVRAVLGRPTYADARRVLMLRHAGHAAESDALLRTALAEVEDAWLHSLFRMLNGELDPDRLIAAAGGDREHECEAYYYAGEMYLLAGHADRAREHFEKSVETGVVYDLDTFPLTPMNEHELALWRLGRLPAPTSPVADQKIAD